MFRFGFTMISTQCIIALLGWLLGVVMCQNCKMPLNPPGISIDPLRIGGVWYEYMYYAVPPAVDYNCINVYTPLNATVDPSSGNVTIAFNWTITFSIKTPAVQCVGMCIVGNVTTDGLETVAAWIPTSIGGTGARANLNYSILYTDYTLIEIAYRCGNPTTTSQYCDSPLLWINLRYKPSTLDKSTKDYVASTVNNVLSRYCFSVSRMSYTNWDDTLPACAPIPPAECAALMAASVQKPPPT